MWQKFEFFILSMFLLFVLLFINKVPYCFEEHSVFVGWTSLFKDHLIVSVSVVFMLMGLLFYYRFNYNYVRGAASQVIVVTEFEDINYESVTFLATYIVPLACIDLDKTRSEFMLITILTLIGWIYIKTNLFYTNPTLAIWGYHIYRLKHGGSADITIIVRGKIAVNDSLRLRKIDEKIYLATK